MVMSVRKGYRKQKNANGTKKNRKGWFIFREDNQSIETANLKNLRKKSEQSFGRSMGHQAYQHTSHRIPQRKEKKGQKKK